MTNKEIYKTIDEILTILENNFRYSYGQKISFEEIFEMMKDLYCLLNNFETNTKECGEISIKRYIPLLDLLVKIDNNSKHYIEYDKMLKYAYKLGARVSLEHYFVYREWEMTEKERFFAPRYPAISGYIHFLQEIVLNPKFTDLVFNAPAGFGKTFPEKITEAWSFGIDPTGAILSLCSNDTVVKNGSALVRQEMKSEWFGEVFPHMKWDKEDKDYYLKETDGEWKLRDCKLGASYNAATCNSNVIGQRASKFLHVDDLYKSYKEAMNKELNTQYYNDYQLSWRTRFVLNATPKVITTGTLWSSGDFIDMVIKQLKKENKFKKHPKYPYTIVSEDGSTAIIQLPALDENGKSVFPELKTTEDLLKIKNRIDDYLWQNNYMQNSTDPEELFFSYNKLRTYETIPPTDYKGSYAVIDATRKSGKDFFAMPIFKKVDNDGVFDYYLKDCLFTRTATKDMYEAVVEKIIEHHIIRLVIESNVTSELKMNIEIKLKGKGITYCEIIEKYNTIPKQTRIELEKGIILKQMVFPKRDMYGINTDMGKFMENLTTYNSSGRNANDDACFEKGTLIATKYGNIPIEKIKKGMKVITPFGLKEVEEAGVTGYKKTITKFGLKVTKNHKIFDTQKSKFIPIDRLTISTNNDILSLKGMILWKKKLLYLMEKYTKEAQKADTILSMQPRTKIELANHNYIEQYGNTTMGKSQKGIIYIIKIVILITTTFLIWSVYQLGNICRNILKKIGKMKNIEEKCQNKCLEIAQDNKNVKNGIKVKKVNNGIKNMERKILDHTKKNKKKEYAIFVNKNILQNKLIKNIVLLNANKKELTCNTQKFAKYVEKNFSLQVISLRLVQENVKEVYNIKVKDAGCYYANGILVSNCDSAALFGSEIIEENSQPQKAEVLDFVRRYM